MVYVDLKCCDSRRPIGVEKPVFSWKIYNCGDSEQRAYRIFVFKNDAADEKKILVWDSGRVDSKLSYHIGYDGNILESNTEYVWQVHVYTEKNTVKSSFSSFITGLFDFSDVKWISPEKKLNSPFVYREFELDRVSSYSTVNICGLGFFELYINGKKVSEDFMNPVRTDYDTVKYENLAYPYSNETIKSAFYLTYEVSELLRAGKNQVVVWLGNGWFRQKGRTVEGIFDYGEELKMFFRLTNGDDVINSDSDWKCTGSPILYDNLFYGEIYDSRINSIVSGFCEDTKGEYVHLAAPPSGTMKPQACPGDRIIETSAPMLVCDGVYDAGKCMSGIVEITVSGKSGDKIEICYAEMLDENASLKYDSTVGYVESDKEQIQKDVYILNGKTEEIYMPRFVWHAFRYFSVSADEGVVVKNVKTHFLCTELGERSHFKCSSRLLNTLHEICLNTLKSNAHGCVPVDCPHRERLGYTGDGQAASLSMMYNFDTYMFYSKWIDDIIDAQDADSGFIPHTAPFYGGGGGPAWGSAIAVVSWNLYMQSGDRTILEKCKEAIRKWIKYLSSKKVNGLVACEENGSWCLGDWVMPSRYPWSEPHVDETKIPPKLVNTVYYIYCIDVYMKILKLFGEEAEQWLNEERADSVMSINKLYLNGCYAGGEQGSNVFPLFAGVVPKECIETVLKNLIDGIKSRDYCFDTGMFGTNLLLTVLDKHNRNDVALKMLLNEKYPSYGNIIKNGATALWETWEGNGSQNHTSLSSVDSWLFYGLAGIKPDGVNGGYQRFSIKPYFAEEIDYLDAEIDSEYGLITLSWRRKGEKLDVHIEIPFNTEAIVFLQKHSFILKPGNYDYCVKGSQITGGITSVNNKYFRSDRVC